MPVGAPGPVTPTHTQQRAASEADLETPADGGRADRPGSFGRQPVRVPGAFMRKNVVAPHSSPDLEIGKTGRTSVGVFGTVDRIEPTDARNSTSKTMQDLGAGVTLQYKFGQ